ncbi:hypothetical protein OF83DRAFT_1175908 [Amylostereum chailletii]|nr:hypothetical protein OF83DRAFT_1175908 [Amylostereum chailletii]
MTSTEEMQKLAVEDVRVGSETLFISKSYLWRNDQPRVTSLAEEAFRATLSNICPTHIAVTLNRKEDFTNSSSLATVIPHLVALHVIRDGHFSPVTVHGTAPDAPNSALFTWPAPPSDPLALTPTQVEISAQQGAFFLATPLDGGRALGLCAWNGPTWSSLRNGIDDMIDYHAVVEFEGGVFLTSSKQRLQVEH